MHLQQFRRFSRQNQIEKNHTERKNYAHEPLGKNRQSAESIKEPIFFQQKTKQGCGTKEQTGCLCARSLSGKIKQQAAA